MTDINKEAVERIKAQVWQEAMKAASETAMKMDSEAFDERYKTTFRRKRFDREDMLRSRAQALDVQAEDARDAILAIENPYEVKK